MENFMQYNLHANLQTGDVTGSIWYSPTIPKYIDEYIKQAKNKGLTIYDIFNIQSKQEATYLSKWINQNPHTFLWCWNGGSYATSDISPTIAVKEGNFLPDKRLD